MSHLLMRNISLKEELHYHYVFLFPCGHLYLDQWSDWAEVDAGILQTYTRKRRLVGMAAAGYGLM